MKRINHFLTNKKILLFLISQQIFFFFLGSFTGFLWEVLLYLIQDGTFIKRGFFYGPWLPIYGVGSVTFYLLFAHPLQRAKIFLQQQKHPKELFQSSFHNLCKYFFQSLLIGTGIELFIGWFVHTFWGLRYWTYEGVAFNFHGYICLSSSICFGIAGVLWIGFLADRTTLLWIKIPSRIRQEINTILVLIFLVDCIASLLIPNTGNSITFH